MVISPRIGLPNQMAKVSRRFDFAAIVNTDWRQVAKEQVVAMLAPRHHAVALSPRAYRTPLHLLTGFGRLAELTQFLNPGLPAGASPRWPTSTTSTLAGVS